ncbi:phosphatase PAP2 family protein [Gammaproteobacteria bacterium]|nr:phosphatase PAP2 family protein [Gammaproteobacteria bacterium]
MVTKQVCIEVNMNKNTIIEAKTLDSRNLLLWPTLVYFCLMLCFTQFPLDQWFADSIFSWEGGEWILRDAWLTSAVIHEGGRKLVLLVLVLVLLLIAATYCLSGLKSYRRGFLYIIVSAITSGVLVNLLKTVSGIDCPWDLQDYGGDRIYQGWSALFTLNESGGNCFPAGHASAAYAWFGVYFFTLHHFPQWRRVAITTVILFGLVFGISQQLRGAHFLSHDLTTAWICWMTAVLMAPFFLASNTHCISDRRKSEGVPEA